MVRWRPKRNPQADEASQPARGRWLRRTLRLVFWLVVDLLLVVMVALLLSPSRGFLLARGVEIAARHLPGDLRIEVVRWPSFGRIECRDLLWTIAPRGGVPDTLFAVDTLMVAFDLEPLRYRDVKIDSVRVSGRILDLPRLLAVMEDAAAVVPTDTTVVEQANGGGGFPREGSLAGVPSVSVGRFGFELERLIASPELTATGVAAQGSAEFRADHGPELRIGHFAARGRAGADTAGSELTYVDLAHAGLGVTLETRPDSSGRQVLVGAVLDSLVLELGPSGTAAMLETWQDAGAVHLNSRGTLAIDGTRYEADLDTGFRLPDTEHFRSVLPDSFPHEEFGDIVGRLEVAGSFDSPRAAARIRLDLAPGTGLDRGLVVAWADCDLDALRAQGLEALAVKVDTLDLGYGGSWVQGRASLDRGSVVLDVGFHLPGDGPVRAFLPDTTAVGEIGDLGGRVAIEGSYDETRVIGRVRLDLGASERLDEGLVVGSVDFDVDSLKILGLPALTARLDTLDAGLLDARLRASGAIAGGDIALDLEAELDSTDLPSLFLPLLEPEGDLQIDLQAHASGTLASPEIAIDLWGRADLPQAAVGDLRLTVTGGANEIEAALVAGRGLTFQDTRLDSLRAGIRGRYAGIDTLRFGFDLAAWQEDAFVGLGGEAARDSVRTLRLDSLVARGAGQSMRLQRPAAIVIGPGPEDFKVDGLVFDGDAGGVGIDASWDSTTVDLTAAIDLLLTEELLQALVPAAVWSTNGGMDLQVRADLSVSGEHEDPLFNGVAGVQAISHRGEPPLGIDLDFHLAKGDTAGLMADLTFSSGGTTLLAGDFLWPGRADLSAGTWLPDPQRALLLRVPEQALNLDLLNKALPPDFGVGGRIVFGAEVAVPSPGVGTGGGEVAAASADSPGRIDGYLRATRLPVDLPNRSRMEMSLDLGLSGSFEDPVLGGKISVNSAFFRIPEIQRNLHPVTGQSLLWDFHDSTLAGLDSLAAGADSFLVYQRPEQVGPTVEPAGPAFLPDMDLDVFIANNLRVTGYGLDVQLGGELKVARGFDEKGHPYPRISGQVATREGSLTFMNRKFKVERGQVQFHGAVPPDPLLDMMLETHVGNNTVRILVSGTAGAPVVELTSDPEMNEADIMAVLLFGRPLNDLDNDQRGAARDEGDPAKELRENLAGLAMAFGTAGIQDSVTETMGVDMVGMGSDSKGDATLMVGKFITPEVMVKYEQSLEKTGTYFMTLEYSLSQYFKLVSTYGQGEEASGAEVKWTRRF